MVLVAKKQKTPPIHHRKRQAHHHKRDDAYHKPYWPYLPMLGIIGFGFLLNLLWTPLSQAVLSRGSVLSFSTNTSITSLLSETNAQRSAHSIGSLALNSQLNNAAQAKANDMAARNYWSHENPDGVQPWQFITNAGYSYTTAGENLAYGFDSSAAAITGWMNSPGHRANLLNSSFYDVGFGIANAEDYQGHGEETIVVAMYGAATSAPAATPAPAPVAPATAGDFKAVPANSQSTAAAAPTSAPSAPVSNPERPATRQSSQTASGSNSATFGISLSVPEHPRRVTRMELASDTVPSWSIASAIGVIVAGSAWLLSRHLRALHRTLVRGEQFVVHHVAFDIVIVGLITLSALAARTAGFIN